MKIQTIALAAAVAVAPVAASAMTIAVGGGTGTYLLGDCPGGASMVIGDVTAAGGAGSHDVSFESCSEPANGIANASITIAVASVFENLTMSWENGESVVITDGSGNLVGGTMLAASTVFTAATNPQLLSFAWTGSLKDASFDYDVSAVPVPAGLLLLGTALAGLGLARRKA